VSDRSSQQDLYAILGVSPSATTEQLREARSRLLKRFHPDKGVLGDTDRDTAFWTARTAEVNAAWDVLKDPATRADYDSARRVEPQSAAPSSPPPGPVPAAAAAARVSVPLWPRWVTPLFAALLILAAVFLEACASVRGSTAEGSAANARSLSGFAEAAEQDHVHAAEVADEALAREQEASQRAWALERQAQIRRLAAFSAGVRLGARLGSRLRGAAAVSLGAIAWTAGAASWLISAIPLDTAKRFAAWAEGIEDAVASYAGSFRDAARESRQWLEAERLALDQNAHAAREAADHAWEARADARRVVQDASLRLAEAERRAAATRAAADEAAQSARLADDARIFVDSLALSAWWAASIVSGLFAVDFWLHWRRRLRVADSA